MAQAVYDDHPLREYLQDAGEHAELIPGTYEPEQSADEFSVENDGLQWLIDAVRNVLKQLFPDSTDEPQNPFVERFKYAVISSTLLATSLPLPSSQSTAPWSPFRQGFLDNTKNVPAVPGNLHIEPSDPPIDDEFHSEKWQDQPGASKTGQTQAWWLLAIATFLGVILFLQQLPITALSVITGAALVSSRGFPSIPSEPRSENRSSRDSRENESITSTLACVSELVQANEAWETAVQEAFAIVEQEAEDSPRDHGPTHRPRLSLSVAPSPSSSKFTSPAVSPSPSHRQLHRYSPSVPQFLSDPSQMAREPTTGNNLSRQLRMSLHSTLLTTSSNLSSIRPLFDTITEPNELSILSEMYAPNSSADPDEEDTAMKRQLSRASSPEPPSTKKHFTPRPLSLAASASRTAPSSPVASDKRATWSHNSPAGRQMRLRKKSDERKRRSELKDLWAPRSTGNLRETAGGSEFAAGSSAPVSPQTPLSETSSTSPPLRSAGLRLSGVLEEVDDGSMSSSDIAGEGFGRAALSMHKRRKSRGMTKLFPKAPTTPNRPNDTLSVASPTPKPPPLNRSRSYSHSAGECSGQGSDESGITRSRSAPRRSPRPMANSTSTPRLRHQNPLSLVSLKHTLEMTLQEKRYTCAHMLALRFESHPLSSSATADEEDSCPTDALTTARNTLSIRRRRERKQRRKEAESEAYWEDVRSVLELVTSALVDGTARLATAIDDVDQSPTSIVSKSPNEDSYVKRKKGAGIKDGLLTLQNQQVVQAGQFAPAPSQFARFASHVEALNSALDDAKGHLEECVENLKVDVRRANVHEDDNSTVPQPVSATLEAYERLRRELGMALRECERGRERLLDLLQPPASQAQIANEEGAGTEDDEGSVPALGFVDAPSDESSVTPYDPSSSADRVEVSIVSPTPNEDDDATIHLLRESIVRELPDPHGEEQVFESESDIRVGAFNRERSKLSREERIKQMKERREAGLSAMLPPAADDSTGDGDGVGEKWGPGGEVVQELKDVIWKVGERRRKMRSGGGLMLPPLPDMTRDGSRTL